MKRVFSILLVVTMILSLCACGGGNDNQTLSEQNNISTSTKDIKDSYIGVWEYTGEIPSDSQRYVHQLKVFKGGTGERVIVDKGLSEPVILSFSWEIVDDVFNLIDSNFGDTGKMGFVIENNMLISVNGEYEFKKIDK